MQSSPVKPGYLLHSTAADCGQTHMSSLPLSILRSYPNAFVSRWVLSRQECSTISRTRGCSIGGVTLGERGLIWYDETGTVRSLPALAVPPNRVLDTSGAGDVFHGAYIYSYLADAAKSWEEHFQFARAASAYKIQHLGNEAGLPTLADIITADREFTRNNACTR